IEKDAGRATRHFDPDLDPGFRLYVRVALVYVRPPPAEAVPVEVWFRAVLDSVIAHRLIVRERVLGSKIEQLIFIAVRLGAECDTGESRHPDTRRCRNLYRDVGLDCSILKIGSGQECQGGISGLGIHGQSDSFPSEILCRLCFDAMEIETLWSGQRKCLRGRCGSFHNCGEKKCEYTQVVSSGFHVVAHGLYGPP